MAINSMELIINRQEADAIRAGLQMLKTRDLQGGFLKDTLTDVIVLKKSLCELSNEEIDDLCDLLNFEKRNCHPKDRSTSYKENMLTQIT